MAIAFACRCGKTLQVSEQLAGKQVSCPECACALDIPPLASHATPRLRSRWLWIAVAAPVAVLGIGLTVGLAFFLGTRVSGPSAPGTEIVGQPNGKPSGQPAKADPTGDAPQTQADAPAKLAQKVHKILKTSCHRCHGQDGENEGGLNYILDLKTLVARNKVVPGKPDDSVLYQRVAAQKRPMPPKAETPRPGEADVAVLRQWIESGAPGIDTGEDQRAFLAEADIFQFIQDDLQKIEARDRRFARYFTITHLYNAGRSEDELQTYRLGLSKLVNSLSWERDIEAPQPVDPARTIFRIDLRHYQWTPAVWQRLLADYPYGLVGSTETAKAVAAATACVLPHMRADWFVFAASRPPLYHDVLQLPKTDRELEQKLLVDVDTNVRQEKVARAGFNSSGVSSNNRLVERHRSSYGAYWKSYDFAHNQDRKNLFAHPLGPNNDANTFQHDGGEIIFSLPNGLQGYLLTDARGVRIDKGPTAIVRDDRQPDRAVVNGVSCMSCHAHGMIDKVDQVREHVQKNARGFAPDVAATILALYPPRDKFAALLKEDADRFAAAVKKTGAHLSTTEPIAALALRYNQELDLRLAAAESGLELEVFRKGVERHPELARALGPLNTPGGTVQRDVFVGAFRDIASQLRLGKFTSPNAPANPPVAEISGDVFALIEAAVKENRIHLDEKGIILGKDQFRDVLPEGALLIGFEAALGAGFAQQPRVTSLRPIFLTRNGEKLGQWHRPPSAAPTTIKAKPGYVVGAVNIRTSTSFDGLSVNFVKLDRDHLQMSDNYTSAWIGSADGRPETLGGRGSFFAGICGHLGIAGNLCALGSVTVLAKE